MKNVLITIIILFIFSLNNNLYAQVSVSYPNSGSSFTRGQTITITWTNPSGCNVNIYLERNSSRITTIATNATNANNGSYSWNVIASANSGYYIRVFTQCGSSGNSYGDSGNFTINNPAPSNPPSNVSATARSSSSIRVSWNSVSYATSYSIEECNGSVSSRTTSSTSTTFTGLNSGRQYSFKVKAINSSGSSNFSSCASATTPYPTPIQPDRPSGDTLLFVNPPNSNYTTSVSNYATSYSWHIQPSNAGSISGTGTNATVDWNNNFSGEVLISVAGVNNSGRGPESEQLRINIIERSVIFKNLDFYTQVPPNPSNPNNYLNQDLPIRFKIKAKNELAQNLASLSAIITSTTPGVTITDNTVNFTAMQAGDEAWSGDEFEITVDSSVADGTVLEFEMSCNDPLVSGGPWISSFSFPIAPLQVNNIVLIDNQGDNDGVPEPGEDNILTQPKIDNVSNNTLEQVRGILTSEDTFLNITQSNYLYNVTNNIPEPINVGDVDVVPAFPYQFNYPSNEALQELNFNLELQANLDTANGALLKWQTTFSFNDGIEPPPSIVSTSPADDAIDVAVDGNLVITFDKPLTAVTGKNIYIYNNGTLENTIDVTDSQINVSNEVVTINPTNDLQGGVDYYIIIENGAFVDNSSQAFTGIINPATWNFTTLQNNPPTAPVLTVNVLSDTEIELNWNVVAGVDNYTILSCNGTTTYASAITSTTYTATNLTPSTTYDFIVKAENAAGLSPASNCETATTLCAVPWGSPVIYTTYTRALCEVTIDGHPAEEHDKVAAYVGSELRGIGDVFISNGVAYAVVSIQGNAIETASFKIWDSSACAEVGVLYTTTTNPNGTIGTAPNYLPVAGLRGASITGNVLNKQIKVFPNPTDNILHITTTKNITINNIQIIDILGSLVYEVKQPIQDISLKKLSKGVYFIHVLSNKGDLVVKVVKK